MKDTSNYQNKNRINTNADKLARTQRQILTQNHCSDIRFQVLTAANINLTCLLGCRVM
jgi:hypothetical protein